MCFVCVYALFFVCNSCAIAFSSVIFQFRKSLSRSYFFFYLFSHFLFIYSPLRHNFVPSQTSNLCSLRKHLPSQVSRTSMSQRNSLQASSSSSDAPAVAEDSIGDLVEEVEKLTARIRDDNDDDVDDDYESTRSRLCSLLIQLHSPGVLCLVAFDHLESQILRKTCPSTRSYFETLSRDLQRLRAEALEEAVGCMEALVELTSFVVERVKGLDPVTSLRNFESLPATGMHVIKSCYKICADIG